jgi:hypothetical protein
MRVEKHAGFHVASVFFVRFQPKIETTIKFFEINLFSSKFHENLLGSFQVVTCVWTDGRTDIAILMRCPQEAKTPSKRA